MDHFRHLALAGLIALSAIVIGCTSPTGGGASGAPASAAPAASVAPAGESAAPGASSATDPYGDDEYTAP